MGEIKAVKLKIQSSESHDLDSDGPPELSPTPRTTGACVHIEETG